jgi:hypothetical protein
MSTASESNGRAEFCRRAFTKYPRWTDALGRDRALSDHPCYDVCRNFHARALDSDAEAEKYESEHGGTYRRLHRSADDRAYRLVDEWRDDLAEFVYGVAREIGNRPDRYWDLKPRDPSRPIGPGNVEWRKRGWANTKRAQAAEELRPLRRVPTPSGATISQAEADSLHHFGECESPWVPVTDCRCTSWQVEAWETW